MEAFLCDTNPHPEPGVWALKKQCREVDQELDYQFTHRNLTKFKTHKCQTQKNVHNHLANVNSWPERMRSCKTHQRKTNTHSSINQLSLHSSVEIPNKIEAILENKRQQNT